MMTLVPAEYGYKEPYCCRLSGNSPKPETFQEQILNP